MRNMSLGLTAFVVSVGMVSVSAQGRNFSGTWVIDSEKTMAAAQASGESPEARVIAGGGGAGGAVVSAGGGGGMGGAVIARSGSGTGGGAAVAGGRGGAVGSVSGGGGGTLVASAGGGGTRVAVNTDMVITMDANTFTTDTAGLHTSYPLNGNEVTVQLRNSEARAKANWKGDTLVIETTVETPTGPLVSTTSWFLEGDSLVRQTTRKTYYKRK